MWSFTGFATILRPWSCTRGNRLLILPTVRIQYNHVFWLAVLNSYSIWCQLKFLQKSKKEKKSKKGKEAEKDGEKEKTEEKGDGDAGTKDEKKETEKKEDEKKKDEEKKVWTLFLEIGAYFHECQVPQFKTHLTCLIAVGLREINLYFHFLA